MTNRKGSDRSFLNAVLQNSIDAVVVVDVGRHIVYANAAVHRILSYEPERLIGTSLDELCAPEEKTRLQSAFQQAVAHTGIREPAVYKIRHADGHWIFLECRINNQLRNPDIRGLVINARDITSQKNFEDGARESERKFRIFFENSPDYCYMVSPDGKILDINSSFLRVLGYAKEEIIGRHVEILYASEPRSSVQDRINRWLKTGQLRNEELTIQTKNGRRRDVLLSVDSVYNESGQLLHSLSIQRDITELKKSQAALQTSEKQFRDLFDTMSEGVALVDPIGRLIKANPSASRIIGLSRDEIEGTSALKPELETIFTDGSPMPAEARAVPRALKEKEAVQDVVIGIKRRGGETVWINSNATPIFGPDGKMEGIVSTFTDITRRMETEQKLLIHNLALDSSLNGVALADMEGHLTYVNPAFLKLWGYDSPEEVLGSLNTDFWIEEEEARKVVFTLIEKGSWSGELKGRRKDGTAFDVLVLSTLVKNSSGKPLCYMASFIDVTDQKRSLALVRKSREKLRSLADRLQTLREEEKKRVSQRVHDDLGQMLTAVSLEISRLQKFISKDPAKAGEIAEHVKQLLHTSLKTIQNLSTELRPTLLDELGLLPAMEWQAREFERKTGIKYQIEAPGDILCLDDKQSLAIFRIFQEALTNVIRHAKATCIAVLLGQEGGRFTFRFSDDGRGISSKEIASPMSLGIFAIEEAVQALGGDFDIQGRPGQGTIISVDLPLSEHREQGSGERP